MTTFESKIFLLQKIPILHSLSGDGVDSSKSMDDETRSAVYGDYHDIDGFVGAVHRAVSGCEAP